MQQPRRRPKRKNSPPNPRPRQPGGRSIPVEKPDCPQRFRLHCLLPRTVSHAFGSAVDWRSLGTGWHVFNLNTFPLPSFRVVLSNFLRAGRRPRRHPRAGQLCRDIAPESCLHFFEHFPLLNHNFVYFTKKNLRRVREPISWASAAPRAGLQASNSLLQYLLH